MKAIGVYVFLLCLDWCAAHAEQPQLRVNGQRIVRHLEALSEYGKNPQGGVSRVAYTEADRAGRQYVMGLMRDAGLEVSIDTAGNLVGNRAGSHAALKPIVIGSHIDSVPEGGNYDGDVGSLGAIEVAHILNERRALMRHPTGDHLRERRRRDAGQYRHRAWGGCGAAQLGFAEWEDRK